MQCLIRKIVVAVLFAALYAVPSYAIDFKGAGLGMGVYVPTGDASDYLDVGYSLNGNVDFNLVPIVDLRFFANYYKADGDYRGRDYDFKSYGGGGMLIVRPSIPVFSVYAGAGYAVYRNDMTITAPGYRDSYQRWGHGPRFDAGIGYNLFVVDVGLHASYFMNLTDGDNMGGLNIGLSAGIKF